jgi:hypothetical protein
MTTDSTIGKLPAEPWSTEYEAALLQTPDARREQYRLISRLLGNGRGMTDDELRDGLAAATGKTPSKSGPATRRGELVEQGLVRPQRARLADGTLLEIVKRPSNLGVPMIVWELVPEGEPIVPQPRTRTLNAAGRAAAQKYAEDNLALFPAEVDEILQRYLGRGE